MKTSLSPGLRRLIITSILDILVSLVAAALMILANRPAVWSKDTPVLQSFLYGQGTAMSPSLVWLALQGILTWLAARQGRWGSAGVIGLVIFGLLFGIFAFSEPILREVFNPQTFDPLLVVIEIGIILLPFLMAWFGILELISRWRSSRPK